MNLDGILIYRYVLELQKQLPIKINKLHQINEHAFIFQVRSQKTNKQLLISLDNDSYRIHFTDKKYTTSFEPTSFLMLLRKYLTQSVITNISQPAGDRVVVLEIETLNNLKDKVKYYLYIELFGKYTNMILVNQENKIIDCLKRNNISASRILFPNAIFEPTHNQNKTSIFENSHLELSNYNGLSKIIKDELLYCNLSVADFSKAIINSETIYYYPEKSVFHLIPLTHLNIEYEVYPLHQALDIIYNSQETKRQINEISGNIYKHVKKELDKANKKLIKLNSTLETAKNYDINRQFGEILYANSHITTRLNEISLLDFEGQQVTIPLDIKYDIKENAHRYFKKYTKNKVAVAIIQQQIQNTLQSIQYYETIQAQLAISNINDAYEIGEELKINTKKNIKSTKQKHPNFLKINIDNVEIYVGKNNIQNDYITNKLSKKHYLWFHVKDYHGAHVVVNQSEVNEKILRICAMLAAYYSKARYSSSIPVNYCLLKQLKATRGNHLGMVFLGSYKTIHIDIDTQLMTSLINKS